MSVIRAFIAIEIPPAIHAQLDHISQELRSQTKTWAIHWVAVNNIHLTLKFLGEVPSTNLDLLTRSLNREVAKHSTFEINVGGLGAFPSIRRPRVIWIGIEAPSGLYALQKGIDAETLRLGYQTDERGFSPHLTLARLSQNASPDEIRQISEVLMNDKVGRLGTFKAEALRLFKSDLLPSGAVYTPLFTTALNPPPANV